MLRVDLIKSLHGGLFNMPYDDPHFEKMSMESCLRRNNLTHLKVRVRKPHIALYMEHDDESQNCCRFTRLRGNQYGMSMADHTGRWEETPFTGTIEELLDLVVENFPWMINDLDA